MIVCQSIQFFYTQCQHKSSISNIPSCLARRTGDMRPLGTDFLGDPEVFLGEPKRAFLLGDLFSSANSACRRGEFRSGDRSRDLEGDNFELGDESGIREGEFSLVEKSKALIPGDFDGSEPACTGPFDGEKSRALRVGVMLF